MQKIISWATVFGAIAVEKVLGGLFFYYYFRNVVKELGIISGCIEMFLIQLIISIVFIYIYDSVDKDIFGIVTIRSKMKNGHLLEKWPKVSCVVNWITSLLFSKNHPIMSFLSKTITFILVSIQFMPPIPVLCLRKERTKGIRFLDAVLIFLNVAFTTVYWTVFHFLIVDSAISLGE